MPKLLKIILAILACLTVGFFGNFFTLSSIPTWYTILVKPSFNPPNWIFGPVWTTLYILMGVSVALVWQKGLKTRRVRDAIYLFGVQLALNAIWSPIFFGYKNIFLALIVIILMLFFIIKTIVAFTKINKTASLLLYPYAIWVSFATILNFSILILNR